MSALIIGLTMGVLSAMYIIYSLVNNKNIKKVG